MNNTPINDSLETEDLRHEIEDRLMDGCLEELLSGVTPDPEHRNQKVVSQLMKANSHHSTRSSRRLRWMGLLSGVAVCVGLGVMAQNGLFAPEAASVNEEVAMSDSSETLPSAYYLRDDVQYYGTEPANRLHSPGVTPMPSADLAERNRDLGRGGQSPAPGEVSEMPLKTLGDEVGRPASNTSGVNPGDAGQKTDSYFDLEGAADRPSDAHPFSLGGAAPEQEKAIISRAQGNSKQVYRYGIESTAVDGLGLRRKDSSGRERWEFESREQTRDFYFHDPDDKPDGSEGVGPGNRGDNYAHIIENRFLAVEDSPLSTFSIDVDTASYSNMRRMLTQNNMLPPPDAVRIEEMVNYFNYQYPAPEGDDPFSVSIEAAQCPWEPEHQLVRVALKGREIPLEERPASNLVFLLDVSGSMNQPNKIGLLKTCLKMMVDYLGENDSIAIVTYASGTRVVLPSTSGDQKSVIMNALDQLQAGGSTNGAAGIQLAYDAATKNFIPGGINRVILATDGDFNVGVTSQGDLHRLIEEKAKSKVFLTTLGFGFGNLQDNTIEMLANKGNGNYAYIDSLVEGRKVLIDEMGSTLQTIAKDVKIQIEFNPLKVAGYRLVGYENRILAARDFNDDTKDAGEIGAGHTVTAFYELIPASEEAVVEKEVDDLEFQRQLKPTKAAQNGDLMMVKLRYKQPEEDTSDLLKMSVGSEQKEFAAASRDFRFASSVASFGMLLRGSQYSGSASYDGVLEIAEASLGESPESYRVEFVELVKLARGLDKRK